MKSTKCPSHKYLMIETKEDWVSGGGAGGGGWGGQCHTSTSMSGLAELPGC